MAIKKKKVKKKTKKAKKKIINRLVRNPENTGHGKRVTDELFWEILEKKMGNFALTSREIESQLGFKYSRQAARQRAYKDKERYREIKEVIIDIAEARNLKNIHSSNDLVSQRATEFTLKTLGKDRGWYMKKEIELDDKRSTGVVNEVRLPAEKPVPPPPKEEKIH